MNKCIAYLIGGLLLCWTVILLYRNKELTRLNLHAERSIREIHRSKQLTAKYVGMPVDSLFQTKRPKGLLLFLNQKEKQVSFYHYLKETFPGFSMETVANQERILADNPRYDARVSFSPDLDIPQNILCYYSRDTCRYLCLYEPANPWLFESDLEILRKYYVKDYEGMVASVSSPVPDGVVCR